MLCLIACCCLLVWPMGLSRRRQSTRKNEFGKVCPLYCPPLHNLLPLRSYRKGNGAGFCAFLNKPPPRCDFSLCYNLRPNFVAFREYLKHFAGISFTFCQHILQHFANISSIFCQHILARKKFVFRFYKKYLVAQDIPISKRFNGTPTTIRNWDF